MPINNSNKCTYFAVRVKPNPHIDLKTYGNKIENKVDLVFAGVQASNHVFKFTKGNEYIYLFATKTRKRRGQVDKYCQQHLKSIGVDFEVQSLLRSEFNNLNYEYAKNAEYVLQSTPVQDDDYARTDIRIFDTIDNWYPWQRDIYKTIFTKKGGEVTFKQPHPRHIYSIIDRIGNNGKSSFVKWIMDTHKDHVGRLTYGSSSQLRSSIINIGIKKLYIIDLPRAKSTYDRVEDLLAAIEEVKSGCITSNMYGNGNTLLMDPPHVLILSNFEVDPGLLSADRWRIFRINKGKQLKEITTRLRIKAKLGGAVAK